MFTECICRTPHHLNVFGFLLALANSTTNATLASEWGGGSNGVNSTTARCAASSLAAASAALTSFRRLHRLCSSIWWGYDSGEGSIGTSQSSIVEPRWSL